MARPASSETPPDVAAPDEPTAVLPTPIDPRSTALVVLAVLAGILALRHAQDVLIPLALGLIGSYALEPLVAALSRVVPRALAAALILGAVLAVGGAGIYLLSDQAGAVARDLPIAAQKFRQAVRDSRRDGASPIDTVQQLATEIERSAAEAAGADPVPSGVQRVQVQEKPLDVRSLLWQGGMGVAAVAAQLVLLGFLVYFLLASGDLYKRKLVRLVGSSLSRKKVTVEVLGDISHQIQQFLFVQLVTSLVVGVVSWLALRSFGLNQAAMWGVGAGLFNSIPYFGPVLVTAGVAIVAFLQFGTFGTAAAIAGVTLLITSLEGFLLTPWLVGRAARMNEVAVFASLLFWGWMWGIIGMLLAVPMMMVFKAVCDRVEDLQPIGELLGE